MTWNIIWLGYWVSVLVIPMLLSLVVESRLSWASPAVIGIPSYQHLTAMVFTKSRNLPNFR